MEKIKVVHVANFDIGLKVHLGNYMKYLCDQGYDVSAISPPGRWLKTDTTIMDGIFVKIIPFPPRFSPMTDIHSLVRLVQYFRRQRFHIVHTHTVKPGFIGRLAAKIARVPIIVHTVHGFYFYEGMKSQEERFYVFLEKLGARCCHSILSQNVEDIETAIRKRICPPEKIHYLGNGIDLRRFAPCRIPISEVQALRFELGFVSAKPVVGFVGRLVPEKGIYEFLEAVRVLKLNGLEANFLVVGSPPTEQNHALCFENLLRDYGIIDDIQFLGYCEDILPVLSLMDVIVLPSHGREGIPRVLMESAALGKPVVATRVRGVREAVVDGKTGILVPVRDTHSTAAAIHRLVSHPKFACEMGAHARQRALNEFDELQFFNKTDMEYRRLLHFWRSQDRNENRKTIKEKLL